LELTNNYTLKSHSYLNSSAHILVLAEEASLVVDYHGAIAQKIDAIGQCSANWSEGLIIADKSIKVYRFE
jgi:hypothetical protein